MNLQPQVFACEQPFHLDKGGVLPRYDLVYETHGTLNSDKSNAILVCHALSLHHHCTGDGPVINPLADNLDDYSETAASGWWSELVGPGKAIDTNSFYVVCSNNLGGCHGSTGPQSLDPGTGGPYGQEFPEVTVEDWVHSQAALADHLGIDKWYAVAGGSLGGMQALQWSISYPERVANAVIIAAAATLSAQNIAFNHMARIALSVQGQDSLGVKLARTLGHISYMAPDELQRRFGRELEQTREIFQVESYLKHQADKFSEYFDPVSYLRMTQALDSFCPSSTVDGLAEILDKTKAQFLVISFASDWRFSSARSREIVASLTLSRKRVVYLDIDDTRGHDSFLFASPRFTDSIASFLQPPDTAR